MYRIGELWRRLLFLLRRDQLEHELAEEICQHVELKAQKNLAAGAPADDAHSVARRQLGNTGQLLEGSRSYWGFPRLESVFQDLRFAARLLRKNPAFSAIVVLTLALGIGANTAIFSAVNMLLLRELPVEDSRRLVFGLAMREGYDPFGTSMLEFAAFHDRSHSFTRCGLAELRSFNLIARGEPERLQGAAVQADFLATLGVKPILGRTITAMEDRPGAAPVVLVSYGLWQRRFGGDPELIGQSLNLSGNSTTVIGILPRSFDYPQAADLWIPLQAHTDGLPQSELASHKYEMVARLRPGVSVQQADRELSAIARQLEIEFPQLLQGWGFKVIPLRRELLRDTSGRLESSLLALLAGVGFLLILCCANVAGLLLARGVLRQREIALRGALGATWRRIAQQLVTESLVLAALGGAVGLFFSYIVLPAISALNPIQSSSFAGVLHEFTLDGRALGFLVLVSILTGVLSSLLPAIKAAGSRSLTPLIHEGAQRSGRGVAGRRWLAALVVLEVAIAVTLLSSGGLLMQSLSRLQKLDLGFHAENLLTMHMDLAPAKYQNLAQRGIFLEEVLSRVRQLPGVVSAGTTTNIPLSDFVSYDAVFSVEAHPANNPANVPITAHRLVSPEYLQTLGVTLVQGRLLTPQDRAGAMPVAVISEELARQGWPGENAIGKRIKRVLPNQELPWLTVVGIVKDVKEDIFNFRINRPVWYLPYTQQPNDYPIDLVVKTDGNPANLAEAVRHVIFAVDPDQPVSNVITMPAHLDGVLVTERSSAILMGALAAMGLLLAVIGLYGVMAYMVGQQTGEIGLRAALGARPLDIFRMVFGWGTKLVLVGLSIGLLSALALTRLITTLLYGVKAHDPATFGMVSLLLAIVAMLACYIPARRAIRIDPMVALRPE
ncbi:MAG TPA: ABC transporter permease [Alphaproteobacteria bacterium]|nr:ABC transporter permease [Alphaproteobacteria bacterium]